MRCAGCPRREEPDFPKAGPGLFARTKPPRVGPLLWPKHPLNARPGHRAVDRRRLLERVVSVIVMAVMPLSVRA